MYLWERQDWPGFRWSDSALLEALADARHRQGRFLGQMGQLGFEVQSGAELDAVTEEVVKSSAIEGELLPEQAVRSSVARQLGLAAAGITEAEARRVDGVVAMTLDASRHPARALDLERLFGWHAALFPTGYSGLHRVRVGAFRDDAQGTMRVVSGAQGRHRVHFAAPPAARLDGEVAGFLDWFNFASGLDGLLRAGLAHLWFVTLHPLDDGNGRLARAVTELALAQLEQPAHRYYSVSSQVLRERSEYYDVLERTQKGSLDVTGWLLWFVSCFGRAVQAAEAGRAAVLQRAEFWRRFSHVDFNARQRKVLAVFLGDFEGNMTARKWAALAKTSVDTAQRDLNVLLEAGVLVRNPGGSKRTSYLVAGR